MATLKHLFSYINHSFREGWDSPALTDYGTDRTYTYGDVATQMARLHLYYEQLGLHAGDKIAVCGVNSSNWAVGFLSILSYNAVAVSVLADFTGADIEKLVNHSDAQVLFVGPMVEKKINISHMPALKAVISTADFHLVYAAQPKFREAYEMLDDTFQAIYPQGFKPQRAVLDGEHGVPSGYQSRVAVATGAHVRNDDRAHLPDGRRFACLVHHTPHHAGADAGAARVQADYYHGCADGVGENLSETDKPCCTQAAGTCAMAYPGHRNAHKKAYPQRTDGRIGWQHTRPYLWRCGN